MKILSTDTLQIFFKLVESNFLQTHVLFLAFIVDGVDRK